MKSLASAINYKVLILGSVDIIQNTSFGDENIYKVWWYDPRKLGF